MKDVDVRNRLVADAGVTAIVGDRISTTWLSEGTRLPAITCTYVSDDPQNTLAGEADIEHELITVNLWAKNKVTLESLYSAAKTAMDGFAVRINKISLDDDEEHLFRYAVTYSLWG